MVTAEELVVSITSTGTSETQEDLEDIEESMENTAETAGDAAEDLEGFSQRFAGALSAAVAGLAVGVGGILSAVPVVSEQMAGLFAIFEAFGLQIDQLARQLGAGGLTTTLFNIAGTINNLDGLAGDLAAVFGVIATAVVSAGVAVGAWAVKAKGAIGAASALASAVKTAGGILVGIISGITATTAALAIAAAAIIGFAAAYITNFRGVRDKTNSFIKDIIGFFTDLASTLVEWAGSIASDAFEWGKDIIRGIIDGMTSLAENVAEAVQGVINGMIGVINAALDQLPDAVTSRLGVERFERVDFDANFGTGGSTNARRGNQAARPRIQNDSSVTLDGRDLSESTGRYRAGPSRRQGL